MKAKNSIGKRKYFGKLIEYLPMIVSCSTLFILSLIQLIMMHAMFNA